MAGEQTSQGKTRDLHTYTCRIYDRCSVQVPGFEDIRLLTRSRRLVCDFCSSGQCFAFGFLQIPPRDGHPCRSASGSPCRAHRGLAPPSHPTATTRVGTAPVKALRAMPGAPTKKGPEGPFNIHCSFRTPARHSFPAYLTLQTFLGSAH